MQRVYILSEAYPDFPDNENKYYCIIAISKKAHAAMSKLKVKIRHKETDRVKYILPYEILINPDLNLLKIPNPTQTLNYYINNLCSFHYVLDEYPEYTNNEFNTLKGEEVSIKADTIEITYKDSNQERIIHTSDVNFAFLNAIFNS